MQFQHVNRLVDLSNAIDPFIVPINFISALVQDPRGAFVKSQAEFRFVAFRKFQDN